MDPKTKAVSNAPMKKKKQHSPAVKFILTVTKILIIFFIALSCALVGIAGGAVVGYIKMAPPIPDEAFDIKILTTFIYDKDGNVIAELNGSENKNRVLVKYDQIPEYLRNAYVAIEDERFYQHPGIDLKRTIGAGISFVTNGGHASYGGSTITQQVIKNITGDKETSLQRKVQEQWRALQLEKKKEKWQILELYMNLIYMGYNSYGVESASKLYFNKDVWELSLAQCASLAGITNSPGSLDPFTEKGKENNIKRQKAILAKMLELEMIAQEEYDQAINEELKFVDGSKALAKSTSRQSYFVDQVILDVKKDLMSKGYSEDLALKTIYNYGLKIYTTQDSSLQKAMDLVFTDDKYFPVVKGREEHAQASMVIIDPSKENAGQVRAMYGGYGEKKADMTLNRASSTLMKRQPGSSFKPIAVYAPGIDTGTITAATVVDDVPVYMNTQKKDQRYPTNFESGKYEGLISVHDAIVKSQNVVAAKIWRDLLGVDNSLNYLKKVGIDRDNERYVSIALGGLHEGVNPLQMAAAYVPFVNRGIYYEPITYLEVKDKDDSVLLEKKTLQQKNIAYKEETSFIMTSMMRDVVARGTASGNVKVMNKNKEAIPAAGKTGTSSDFIDKWFVGYTPYYVGATWYGYDNQGNKRFSVSKAEQNQAMKIWNAVMNAAHKDLKKIDFTQPSGLVKKAVCIYSGKTPTDLCPKDPRGNAVREEYFIKGTEPKESDVCDIHVLGRVCKDSTDIYKRNLLFGPNCPGNSLIEKVFIQRKEPYKPQTPGEPYPEDWKYELPEGEYCTIHGSLTGNIEDSSPGSTVSPGTPADNAVENTSDDTADEVLDEIVDQPAEEENSDDFTEIDD